MAVAEVLHREEVPEAPRRTRRVEVNGRARWWRREGGPKRGFRYVDTQGRPVKDRAALERIRALRIPPAWTDVRIAPSPRSCLQAVGVDALGRVQYLYEPGYCARQQRKKFERLERFGQALPALRRATNEHIGLDGYPRERVLAVVVRLINHLYFRVGSEGSVRRYRTYGITTLRNHHLRIERRGRLVFTYRGKHHIRQRKILVDEELSLMVREIKGLDGAKLFQYVGPDGAVRAVTPRDVNGYIKSACGPEFCAKDFRTWGGTLLAAVYLAELGPAQSKTHAKRNMAQAVRRVAESLGNTPAVCRASYIHPAVLEEYERGVTLAAFRPRAVRTVQRSAPEYEVEELALLTLLRDASAQRAQAA